MKYEKIILKGYKRLSLNHIDYIEITPQNKIQLILGTNGSGKSSLIKEISPLPATPAEYHKEGYKYVEITHLGNRYILKSLFIAGGNKFHFIKNDEELNPGGTSSTFKELVKKEFNYTPEIHELMTGEHNFHEMSVAERRNWFIKIPDVDYSYAISYFLRLKEQHRDLQGAIKLSQSRLVQESEKLLTPEAEIKQREEIKLLNEALNDLLMVKTGNFVSQSDVVSDISVIDQKIIQQTESLLDCRNRFKNLECFDNIESIDTSIIDTQSMIQSLTSESDRLCKSIESKQKTLDILKENNIKSLDDLEEQNKKISDNVIRLEKQLNLFLKFQDNKQAFSALLSVYDHLTEIASSIPENKEKKFNVKDYETCVTGHKVLVDRLNFFTAKQQEHLAKKKELEHLKNHSQIECPKCQHRWYQGYSDEAYNENEKLIQAFEKDIAYTNKALDDNMKFIEACKSYLEYYRVYSNITRSWEILNPLWEYILVNNVIFENPSLISNILENLKIDFQIFIKIDEELAHLANNAKIKETLSKDQALGVDNLSKEIETDNNLLFEITNKIRQNKNKLKQLQVYKQSAVFIENSGRIIETLIEQRNNKTNQIQEIAKQELINEAIKLIRLELSQREQLISKIDIQKALVKNIQSQVDEMSEKTSLYSMAIKELSPSEGLIAKGLTGFINHFVRQMNTFIKKIWLYPLEIVPIIPTEDGIDLDFKFEVRINDNLVIPDINKASSAMREIIDLAFRMTSMPYLKLSEAPLFLDEPGANMDHIHRANYNRYINELSINSNFSNVFMISHYHDSYGSFSNTDYIVLDSRNIKALNESAYNKNCVIK